MTSRQSSILARLNLAAAPCNSAGQAIVASGLILSFLLLRFVQSYQIDITEGWRRCVTAERAEVFSKVPDRKVS